MDTEWVADATTFQDMAIRRRHIRKTIAETEG